MWLVYVGMAAAVVGAVTLRKRSNQHFHSGAATRPSAECNPTHSEPDLLVSRPVPAALIHCTRRDDFGKWRTGERCLSKSFLRALWKIALNIQSFRWSQRYRCIFKTLTWGILSALVGNALCMIHQTQQSKLHSMCFLPGKTVVTQRSPYTHALWCPLPSRLSSCAFTAVSGRRNTPSLAP